ncbi:hypothetical protein BDB00DRAFT_770315 [Zychaea mexicana]|uniref:uncharacterized protein n=1 Tax=Zychaea mexicana TaxID=64656 RepID=UPI0022FDFE5B|nr:uncharacterized protein BDB00DRAFT_770315 [Zychaea mexicana]KAI9489653.1 hypothetical protein BDB00DRAFT_770315 [Zychaea mexicana]
MSASPPKNHTSFISDARRPALPWYKIPHRSVVVGQRTMTGHLSTQKRAELQERMVQLAKTKAQEAFGGDTYAGVIPGSIIRTEDQAQALRSLVDCWTQGKWVPFDETMENALLTNPPIKHFQDPLYGTCDHKFYKTHEKDGKTWRAAVKYRWQPACALPVETIDPAEWCRVLRGRNIALVGDLVHYQMHELLLDVLRDGPVVCYGELSCKEHTICTKPKPSLLQYVRNDLLSPNRRVKNEEGHPSASIIDWPFVTGVIQKRFNIFILNRAPVIEDDETFISQLIESMQELRKSKPKALVIYRSTTVGHPYCNDAQGPLDEPLTDMERQELPYGWSEQTRRNAMAKEIVEAAGGLYVDLAALTDMRPDGHIGGQDCLRYCIPGPLDAWATVLYNVMLGLEGRLPLPNDNIKNGIDRGNNKQR